MTIDEYKTAHLSPRIAIEDVVARYGAWRVLFVSLSKLLTAKRTVRPTEAKDLPNFLRKDVGLHPRDDPPVFW